MKERQWPKIKIPKESSRYDKRDNSWYIKQYSGLYVNNVTFLAQHMLVNIQDTVAVAIAVAL